MSLGYPLGLLALSGLAVVIAIHMLRVRARRLTASTLFLLPEAPVESRGGRRLERLRATPLLWLQLVVVALLVWILVEPRWLREDSTLRVVLVVDGSASMSAFEKRLQGVLAEGPLERSASRVEWVVLGSDAREKTLYSGSSREDAIQAAISWRARLPAHDPGPVLATARSIASDAGRVVFLTDHLPAVPPGVEILAVGSPLPNVGFAGIEVTEEGGYRAIVKSSSPSPERRKFWIEGDDESEILELEPFELRFLSGSLASEKEELTLVLEEDAFALDDRLPIVRPRAKLLRVFLARELAENAFVTRFVESLEPVERVSEAGSADLEITRSTASAGAAIVFAPGGGGEGKGLLVAEEDPLTEGLNFQGLLAGAASASALAPEDRALLWQGDRALVFMKEGGPKRLVVSFALEDSNADRVPAFVLLLHRFAESVRASVAGFEQRNVELHQVLTEGDRAPSEPGFFELESERQVLLRGAAHFADVREADFTDSTSRELSDEWQREALEKNSLPDPLRSLWLVGLMGLSVCAWTLQERKG